MIRRIALLVVLAFSAVALTHAHMEADTESAAYWPPTHEHAGLSRVAAVETWNYDRTADIGPTNWYKTTPVCGGSTQSPIDVNTNSVVYDPNLQPIKFNYQQANRTIVNNGHALQCNENAGVTTSTVTGGAMNGMTYAFAQFHVHLMGEHTVNGGAYPLELHLVHSNTDSSQTSPPTPRELTVVGLLFKEGSYNKALENFVNAVNVAGFNAVNSYTTAIIDLTALLPVDPSYYTYQGSLTTPGCRETVTWHVMTQLLEVSSEQLGMLRAAGPVTNNNRPVQPLNGRLVRTNSPALARAGTTSAASAQQAVGGGAGSVVNINFANMLSGFSRN